MGEAPSIAYLTGEYPRATDTWIQREVAALRDRGVAVDTFAVRRPGAEQLVGTEQRAEHARTTYLVERLRSPSAAGTHVRLLVRNPRRYARALHLAWTTRRAGVTGSLYQLAYLAEAGVLAEEVRRRQLSHIHNHFGDSSCTVAMLAAELSGRTFSFTLHGPGIFFEPYTWRLDAKLRRAEFCACISYFCRSQASIFADPDRLDRLHIVHCGIDPDALQRRRHDGPADRLLFVGRLTEVKGLTVLLEALTILVGSHPTITLTVVGDGPDRGRFEARADELGLGDVVDFVGYRSQADVARHLAETDVFVLPSYAEGVPVTLMEALGAAVPVVATQVGGVSELVDHGENGFIVKPGDADELAERISGLLDDPEQRQRLGDAGRGRVQADFSNATEAGRLARLFVDTAAGIRSPLRPEPLAGGPARG